MKKIKVTADTVLAILKGIMDDEDINRTITDLSAPEEWQGKKVQDVLNVEYFTFRHRPVDTEQLVVDLLRQGKVTSSLYALQRAFCILSLQSTERVFSKENDIVTVSASLEYWIQTEKVKLLEDLLEDIIVETTGTRIPVRVGSEDRQVLLAIGKLAVSEIQDTTEFGEMSICDLDIDLVFYPPAITREDYKVEFALNGVGEEQIFETLNFSSLSVAINMTQKPLPLMTNSSDVGNINLSRARSFVFTFDGYKNNRFIDQLMGDSLSSSAIIEGSVTQNNNRPIVLKLTREDNVYVYDCVVKDHIITVKEDTDNELHSLTLTVRGN